MRCVDIVLHAQLDKSTWKLISKRFAHYVRGSQRTSITGLGLQDHKGRQVSVMYDESKVRSCVMTMA